MNNEKILIVDDGESRFAKAAAALADVNRALATHRQELLDPGVESMARTALEASKKKLERFLNEHPVDARNGLGLEIGDVVPVRLVGETEQLPAVVSRVKADGRLTLDGIEVVAGMPITVAGRGFVTLWSKGNRTGLRLVRAQCQP